MRVNLQKLYLIDRSSITPNGILTIIIALVWFINGLFCKILNMVPRHQLIVSRILGEEYAFPATKFIGFLELLMVIWLLSGIKSRLCTQMQMLVVTTMVILEAILVPDLLLFGRGNLIPGFLFVGLVAANKFYYRKKGKNQLLEKV